MTDTASTAVAERLRGKLADDLRNEGTVRTDRVEAAIRAVPRHMFLPASTLDEAYADSQVYTKHDGAGTWISAAGAPRVGGTGPAATT